MKRVTLNYWVDMAMLAFMLGIAFIGVLLGFFIGKGEGVPKEQKQLWGLGRHDWGDIHLWMSMAFLALLILHIILHWNWIVCTTRRIVRERREAVLR